MSNAIGQPRRIRIGFMMDQIAGHITNYHNLRRVASTDDEIDAHWCEISYFRPERPFERMHRRYFPFVSTYVTGNARAVVELRRGLRETSYDVIFSNASIGVFFAKSFARTPTLLDFDSTPLQRDAMPGYTATRDPKPIARLKLRLCRDMFHAADGLQAWSSWAKSSAIADYGVPAEKVEVNPPGVDLSFWQHPPSACDDAADSPTRVLFVGGDFKRKGGDLLLEWFRTRESRSVELHLVTRDAVPPTPGVHVYANLQPNSDALRGLFHRSDVFVLPSLSECFGIATVEAMASGLPVVVTDVGGARDIVDNGRSGYLVPGGNQRSLANALDSLVADPQKRTTMGRTAREVAERRFDIDRNARATLDRLKMLARQDASGQAGQASRGRKRAADEPAGVCPTAGDRRGRRGSR